MESVTSLVCSLYRSWGVGSAVVMSFAFGCCLSIDRAFWAWLIATVRNARIGCIWWHSFGRYSWFTVMIGGWYHAQAWRLATHLVLERYWTFTLTIWLNILQVLRQWRYSSVCFIKDWQLSQVSHQSPFKKFLPLIRYSLHYPRFLRIQQVPPISH